MASIKQSKGYKFEFIDFVSEDFYCKKCCVVARRLSLTSCCGESYCHACLEDTRVQGKPCPACEQKEFNFFDHMKAQKRINSLQVYCSMKERGCVWSGTLEQLDTHLDNCQYVDTKCPLNCLQTIPKNKVDQHVAQECTKRPHVCQHCGFKATYKEVVDTHLPECKYVPLQCPNMCGVSCERVFLKEHLEICRLGKVDCKFISVGCDSRFIREDQDEHARQNSQKHLTLTASLAVETKEQLQQKLLEQDQKHKEAEEKLKKKIGKQEKKLGEQEKKLGEQGKKLVEQEKKLRDQEKKLGEQEKKYDIKLKQLEKKFLEVTTFLGLNRRFQMVNFSYEKGKDKIGDWKSPAMYTHERGYKFCLGVDANGYGGGRGDSVNVDIFCMRGTDDNQLKWPAKAKFTVELINQQGGGNAECTNVVSWDRPTSTVAM